MELIDKQKRHYTAEQLAELQRDFRTVPVDGDGLTIPVEYDERFVRGTVLKLIADLHSTQEEIAKLKEEIDRVKLDFLAEHRDCNRLEARALQAEQELAKLKRDDQAFRETSEEILRASIEKHNAWWQMREERNALLEELEREKRLAEKDAKRFDNLQRELVQAEREREFWKRLCNEPVEKLVEERDELLQGLKYPRQPNKEGGWKILPDFLRQIVKQIENTPDDEMPDSFPSWEQIEMVLLALEQVRDARSIIAKIEGSKPE